MPVTNEQLESMILRVDDDAAYSYDVSIETIIQLAEECEYNVEEMCTKYQNAFAKQLSKNNESISEEQVTIATQQIIQRLKDLFSDVVNFHQNGVADEEYESEYIIESINQQIKDDPLNVITRLRLTETAIISALNICVFNLSTPVISPKASSEALTTPYKAHTPRTASSSARFSAATPLTGTEAFSMQQACIRQENAALSQLLGVGSAIRTNLLGMFSSHESPEPKQAEQSELGRSHFTPSFESKKREIAFEASIQTKTFLKINGFSNKVADIDKCTSEQFPRHTPLTLAALQVDMPVCKSLLQDGAKINATNAVGNTALHMLCHAVWKPEILIESAVALTEYFLANGADVSIKNKEGKTPVDIDTNPSIAKLLKKPSLSKKANTPV